MAKVWVITPEMPGRFPHALCLPAGLHFLAFDQMFSADGKVMAKIARLKSRRKTEAKKIDLAVKYAERGVATGGGRIGTKKVRRTVEARYVPLIQRVPMPGKKRKQGRRHPPPSELFRAKQK